MAQENNILDNWGSPLSDTRNDLVFETRNQEYGAYVIRKKYRSTVLIAFAITAFAGIAATTVPLLINKYSETFNKKVKTQTVEVINIDAPPPKEEVTPPPPPKEPEVKTIEFTEVKVNENAVEEVHTVLDDNETQISTETNEGESTDDVIDIDDNSGNEGGDDGPKLTYQRKVEIEAEFPGGDDAFNQWLSDNIIYPQSAVDNNVQGRVWLEFTVDLDGRVGHITLVQGIKEGPELEQEAMKVLKRSPNWKPAIQNGRSVPAYRRVPIDFVLNQ